MNHHINPTKTAFSVAAFLAGFHFVWAVLVALGWGQPLMDFVFWAHMINMSFVVGPFDLSAAMTLVVMTWFFGYVFGLAFARIWNRMHAE